MLTLALDVGGTAIKAALLDDAGRIVRRPPPVLSHSDGTRDQQAEAFRTAIAQAGDFQALGVAIPGPFDYAKGIFRATHKFAALCGESFADVSGWHGATCFIHDANAFLLGELTAPALRGLSRVAAVTLGTGLGAAFATDGKLVTNADLTPADAVRLWNRPWKDGIAEDYLSTRALLAQCPAPDVLAIAQRAEQGDEQARQAFLDYGTELFALLGLWQAELHAEAIILGGQIAKSRHLFGLPAKKLPLYPATLGGDAPFLGLWQALH